MMKPFTRTGRASSLVARRCANLRKVRPFRPASSTTQVPSPCPSHRLSIQRRDFCHSRCALLAQSEAEFDPSEIPRESDTVDVCIVGGGPAGLSAAIRLKQLALDSGNDEFRVLVLDKGSDIGAHILSGAVIEPRALDELLPDWREDPPSMITEATSDRMRFLTEKGAIPIPAPPQMHNKGNYIMSLSNLSKWMSEKAEELGVEIYPGFAASEVLYNEDGSVKGIATGDSGISRTGAQKENFERGMEFHSRVTLFAEGAHGSLTKALCSKFNLRSGRDHQTYGIGLKEVWEVPEENWVKGQITHSLGWPLQNDTYGGGWMYHFGDRYVSIGLVIGLDYPNPYLSPYAEFQRMKHHPIYSSVLKGGKCVTYGARALNEGGYQSVPKVPFPGGALIGCSAGFVNVPKIKGTHTAMKSGMLAAEAAMKSLQGDKDSTSPLMLSEYEEALHNSWVMKELYQVRNLRPSFNNPIGNIGGILYSGLDSIFLKGRMPWTFHHKTSDARSTKPADTYKPINYPKPDGEISFDILTNVARTGTMHEEDEPIHLVDGKPTERQHSFEKFRGIENRFCPASVYEWVDDASQSTGKRFQINSQNCIHCKTCDIKDPLQNIKWAVPQGGEGPSMLQKYQLRMR